MNYNKIKKGSSAEETKRVKMYARVEYIHNVFNKQEAHIQNIRRIYSNQDVKDNQHLMAKSLLQLLKRGYLMINKHEKVFSLLNHQKNVN